MKKILLGMLFFIMSQTLFAFDINYDNYKDFIGKHFVLIPSGPSYSTIMDKKFDFKKNSGKKFLIKEIKTDTSGIIEVTIQETNDKGKTKDILIKSSTGQKRLNFINIGIAEDLEKAKEMFVGKTLFAENNKAKKHSLKIDFETKVFKGTSVEVIDVVYDSCVSFRLIIDDGYYIEALTTTIEYNIPPSDFTFFNPKEAHPESYRVRSEMDMLEWISHSYIENQLDTNSLGDPLGKNEISFNIWAHSHMKTNVKSDPSIAIKYSSDNWLFIKEAILYIDSNKTSLNLGKRETEVRDGGRIYENFYFEVTKKQIQDIADGKSVTIRLQGDKGYVDGKLNKQGLYNIKRFYEEKIK